MEIKVPPLRERMEDLEPLAQYFLEELNRDAAQQVGGFSDEVWRQLRRYNWPGNVEELSRVVREAREACTGSVIEDSHLPFSFRTGTSAQAIGPSQRLRSIPLDQLLEQVEREHIEQVLAECKDNKAKAAELLGITRPRLYRRMETLGIAGTPDPDEMNGEPASGA
jgi:transcriptional regulator with PAS, ATPase and Fis domain